MNDIENDLRELFQERARDISPTPKAPPGVLRRGRRRQVGTTVVAASTALVVAVTAITVARLVSPASSPRPAAANGLPERTATIQNFTVTAPEGWTMIDWWPASRFLDAGTARSIPVLQVSNFDPGLDATLWCGSGGDLAAGDAVLYVAVDSALLREPNPVLPPSWPVAIDGGGEPQPGPCGDGYYAHFSLGDNPYFAFVGVGSSASDAVRQQAFDAYDAMQAHDGALVPPPAVATPGYVIVAGVENEVPWRLELGMNPPIPMTTNVNGLRGPSLMLTAGDDFANTMLLPTAAYAPGGFALPGGVHALVAGVVPSDVVRVEWRTPGNAPVEATIVEVPDSLTDAVRSAGIVAPDRLYWAVGDAAQGAQVAQILADGSERVGQVNILLVPSGADRAAQTDLRNALAAARTYYTDGATYVGLDPTVAASIEPSLHYNTSPTATPREISIRDVTRSSVLLVTATSSGSVWCIADDVTAGTTTYGTTDAQTAADCRGGDAAWGIEGPTPSVSPVAVSSSALTTIASGTALGTAWTLKVGATAAGSCWQLDFNDHGTGGCTAMAVVSPGGTAAEPPQPAPAIVASVPVSEGGFVLVSVPGTGLRAAVRSSSGTEYEGWCGAASSTTYCLFPLPGSGNGALHVIAQDGSEPFASTPVAWKSASATPMP